MLEQDIAISIEKAQKGDSQLSLIREELANNPRTIVILDDDPTGTQTVWDIPVITEWTEEVLEEELVHSPVFFILTNSRSLQANDAIALGRLIGQRLQKLATKHDKKLLVVSRGDSTLRGHYPNEVDALTSGLRNTNAKHILAPAFFEGGRYTFNDVHYVKEGNTFIPAGKTPFAQDNTFGYTSSNLRDWIREKSKGKIPIKSIASIAAAVLEAKETASIKTILASKATHIIVNALSSQHLETMALACLQSQQPLIFRTAASFVNAIAGIEPRGLLGKNDILGNTAKNGALIVVGSYVPKTSEQLNYLMENSQVRFVRLDVSNVENIQLFHEEIQSLRKQVNEHIKLGNDLVLYTSRKVITGKTKAESLEIVNRISKGVTTIVKELENRPRYILAKGGITSSDIATKALGIKKATVLGQVLKGIPVWRAGMETKFPNLGYIIFPGNVGTQDSLYKIIQKLS